MGFPLLSLPGGEVQGRGGAILSGQFFAFAIRLSNLFSNDQVSETKLRVICLNLDGLVMFFSTWHFEYLMGIN